MTDTFDVEEKFKKYAVALAMAEEGSPGMQTERIEGILELCRDLTPSERDHVLTVLGKKINVGKHQMMSLFKVVEARGRTQPESLAERTFEAWYDIFFVDGKESITPKTFGQIRQAFLAGFQRGHP